MHTATELKSQAKRLRQHLAGCNIPLTHSQALEAIAATHGFRDWNTAADSTRSTPQAMVVTPEVYRELEAKARHDQLEALDGRIRADLLRRLAVIEREGPPGIINSALQMGIDLEARRLPDTVAHEVGTYLFHLGTVLHLPGLAAAYQGDAESLHQRLLALRVEAKRA